MKDTALKFTQNFPAADASAVTESVYIGGAGVNRYIKAKLTTEALPALVDTKTATLAFEKSADNVTFTDLSLDGVATYTSELVGDGVSGADAAELAILVPDGVNYLRARADVESGGGDNTAKTFTLELEILGL